MCWGTWRTVLKALYLYVRGVQMSMTRFEGGVIQKLEPVLKERGGGDSSLQHEQHKLSAHLKWNTFSWIQYSGCTPAAYARDTYTHESITKLRRMVSLESGLQHGGCFEVESCSEFEKSSKCEWACEMSTFVVNCCGLRTLIIQLKCTYSMLKQKSTLK